MPVVGGLKSFLSWIKFVRTFQDQVDEVCGICSSKDIAQTL